VAPVAVVIKSAATMAKLPPVRFGRKDMAANGSDHAGKCQQKQTQVESGGAARYA
jgi:hypothetical protein